MLVGSCEGKCKGVEPIAALNETTLASRTTDCWVEDEEEEEEDEVEDDDAEEDDDEAEEEADDDEEAFASFET